MLYLVRTLVWHCLIQIDILSSAAILQFIILIASPCFGLLTYSYIFQLELVEGCRVPVRLKNTGEWRKWIWSLCLFCLVPEWVIFTFGSPAAYHRVNNMISQSGIGGSVILGHRSFANTDLWDCFCIRAPICRSFACCKHTKCTVQTLNL